MLEPQRQTVMPVGVVIGKVLNKVEYTSTVLIQIDATIKTDK